MAESVGTNSVERCEKCFGVWVGAAAFNELMMDIDRQESVRVHEVSAGSTAEEMGYVKCPRCNAALKRTNFGRSSGVMVDACSKHGVWLDRGELRRVVEFLINRNDPKMPDQRAPGGRKEGEFTLLPKTSVIDYLSEGSLLRLLGELFVRRM